MQNFKWIKKLENLEKLNPQLEEKETIKIRLMKKIFNHTEN